MSSTCPQLIRAAARTRSNGRSISKATWSRTISTSPVSFEAPTAGSSAKASFKGRDSRHILLTSQTPIPQSENRSKLAEKKDQKSQSPIPSSKNRLKLAEKKDQKSQSPIPRSKNRLKLAEKKDQKSQTPIPQSKNTWKLAEKKGKPSVQDVLPPIAFLNSARKAGALEIEPKAAVQVIEQYYDISQSEEKDWEKKLLLAENITPSTLTMLAAIINRCGGVKQKIFAKEMTLTASNLGDATATIQLLKSAVSRGELDHPFLEKPIAHLETLVHQDDNVEATVLLGKILEARGQEERALDMFSKAAKSIPSGATPDSNTDLVSQSLVYRGELLMSKGDFTTAELEFRRAALELDNPAAYHHLARFQQDGSAAKEVYLIKAASSGIVEACCDLGKSQLVKAAEGEGAEERKAMAKEWLYLGASGGHGPSMLSLAEVLKSEGQVKEGLSWLMTAESSPDVPQGVLEDARALREQWSL